MKFSNQAKLMRSIRDSGGLTQHEVSKMTGIHSQAISNIERGVCSIPLNSIKHLLQFTTREKILAAFVADLREKLKELLK